MLFFRPQRAESLLAGRLCPIVPHEYCARHEARYVPGASARRLFSKNRPQQFAETGTKIVTETFGGCRANGEET